MVLAAMVAVAFAAWMPGPVAAGLNGLQGDLALRKTFFWLELLVAEAVVVWCLARGVDAAWLWAEERITADDVLLRRARLCLSDRECQILTVLAREDLSYEQVGERLSITSDTVKTHVRRIADKLGLPERGRKAVVAAARTHGLVPVQGTGTKLAPEVNRWPADLPV